ncbi:MAG: ABC transporter substrate-binding protein [Betaproteobacteria bacterium]|nr:ABC transporter substrate-binding protein [Betaproteobacteria bacterium]
MNRRDTAFALLALGAAPFAALAQPDKRMRRVGVFILTSAEHSAAWLAAFRAGMLELRWAEGRDYVIDARYANGVAKAGPALAAELVATRPDLVLTGAEQAVHMLAQASKTLPVVFAISKDPVGSGIAASLPRPGGNATGLTNLATGRGAKRLQLLKDAFPRVAHVGFLFDPADVGSVSQVKEIEEAAARLRLRITPLGFGQEGDIEPAFKRGGAIGAQAYMVANGAFASTHLRAIVDRITRARVPAVHSSSQYVEAGGLMSYSPSLPDNFRRAAAYVDKILKGAKPGDLPVEQPTRFELVVNLKTAKAIGLGFPQSFLVRVDRAIE